MEPALYAQNAALADIFSAFRNECKMDGAYDNPAGRICGSRTRFHIGYDPKSASYAVWAYLQKTAAPPLPILEEGHTAVLLVLGEASVSRSYAWSE